MAEKHRTLPPNLKQRIDDFSGYTTFHGLHFVIGSDRGIFRRIVWLLLILAGLGVLANQLYISYNKLKAHEHVITREIISGKKLVFPAVTVCNVNMMKKNRIKGTDAQIYLDQQNSFKKIISPNLYANMTLKSSFDIEKAVLRYGHTAKDMIHVCTWDGELCSYQNVTTRFSQIYGLCHTFNSGREGHPLLFSTSIKRSRGLHLFIYVDIDQYYGINSYFNTGIRMVIHDQDEEPMVEVDGIDVGPGHMTMMSIQRTEYHSLPPPFKSGCGSNNLKTSNVYTQSLCLMECNTRKVIQKCGCRLLGMPELPEFNGTKLCNPKEITSCLLTNLTTVELGERIDVILAKYFITYDSSYSSDNPLEECDCPKPCKKVQYKIARLNTVSFLSESFWEDYLSASINRYPDVPRERLKANVDSAKSDFRKDFLFLIMHYDDLDTLKTSEKKAYDITDFGSDVGGYLGLFLGCSILTVLELFDFIICYILGKRKVELQVDQTRDTQM